MRNFLMRRSKGCCAVSFGLAFREVAKQTAVATLQRVTTAEYEPSSWLKTYNPTALSALRTLRRSDVARLGIADPKRLDLAHDHEIAERAEETESARDNQRNGERPFGELDHEAGERRDDDTRKVRRKVLDAAYGCNVIQRRRYVAGKRPDACSGEREAAISDSERREHHIRARGERGKRDDRREQHAAAHAGLPRLRHAPPALINRTPPHPPHPPPTNPHHPAHHPTPP